MKKAIVITLLLVFLVIPIADAKLPFIVRTVYFRPLGTPEADDRIKDFMKQAQRFYQREMERHGYGSKTFRLETDNEGEVIVHTVIGKRQPAAYTSYEVIKPELPEIFRNQNNIHVIFIGGMRFVKPRTLGIGFPFYGWTCGGIVRVGTAGEGMRLSVIAHELGHAFGLYHNLSGISFLMGVGQDELDDYEARWLDKHHYFNNHHEINGFPKVVNVHRLKAIDIKEVKGETVNFIDAIKFRLDVESVNILHQAQLFRETDTAILQWRKLNDNHDTLIFDIERAKLRNQQRVYIQVMDVMGNMNQHIMPIALPSRPVVVDKNGKVDKRIHKEDLIGDAEKNPAPSTEKRNIMPQNKLTMLWANIKRDR